MVFIFTPSITRPFLSNSCFLQNFSVTTFTFTSMSSYGNTYFWSLRPLGNIQVSHTCSVAIVALYIKSGWNFIISQWRSISCLMISTFCIVLCALCPNSVTVFKNCDPHFCCCPVLKVFEYFFDTLVHRGCVSPVTIHRYGVWSKISTFPKHTNKQNRIGNYVYLDAKFLAFWKYTDSITFPVTSHAFEH